MEIVGILSYRLILDHILKYTKRWATIWKVVRTNSSKITNLHVRLLNKIWNIHIMSYKQRLLRKAKFWILSFFIEEVWLRLRSGLVKHKLNYFYIFRLKWTKNVFVFNTYTEILKSPCSFNSQIKYRFKKKKTYLLIVTHICI